VAKLASSARRSTTPLTLALIVLLLGRVVTALSHDALSGWIGEKAMSLVARFPSGLLRWLNWPAWLGVVLSMITFVLAGGLGGPREALIAGPCLIAIAVLPTVLRRAMGAVPNDGVAERTPALGVGVSALLAVAGVAWPPVPTMSASVDHSIVLRARRVVIVAVAGVALVLVVSNILGAVPVSRAVMSVAIASLGSLLVPVKPSDGAYLGKKSGLAATIALAGLTALQALGLA
jgi:cellulose synthase operon protein C